MSMNVVEKQSKPRVEKLNVADISENVHLAQSVGWQDTESEWQVVYAAATVLGVRNSSGLVAQGALGLFGKAGSIAKMVVAKDLQRTGLGQLILEALFREATKQKIDCLGLVATTQGRSFYEASGFVPTGDVVVFMGTPHIPLGHGHATPLENVEHALELDKRLLGCDRSRMLRAREQGAIATASALATDGKLKGYAMATEFGAHALIGPVIADNFETAQWLIISLCQELEGAVRIDVPSDHADFRHWLRSIGLKEQGTRTEMVRSKGALLWRVPERFALATQAWG